MTLEEFDKTLWPFIQACCKSQQGWFEDNAQTKLLWKTQFKNYRLQDVITAFNDYLATSSKVPTIFDIKKLVSQQHERVAQRNAEKRFEAQYLNSLGSRCPPEIAEKLKTLSGRPIGNVYRQCVSVNLAKYMRKEFMSGAQMNLLRESGAIDEAGNPTDAYEPDAVYLEHGAITMSAKPQEFYEYA